MKERWCPLRTLLVGLIWLAIKVRDLYYRLVPKWRWVTVEVHEYMSSVTTVSVYPDNDTATVKDDIESPAFVRFALRMLRNLTPVWVEDLPHGSSRTVYRYRYNERRPI